MTSDNAIPITTTGDVTRLYFDGGSAFGVPHARPLIAIAPDQTWDDEQLLDAAHLGADGRDLHPDLIAALCTKYVDLATAENIRESDVQSATVRAQHAGQQLAAAQGVAAALETRLADLQRELMGCQIALDEERNAHQGTMFAREFAEDLHLDEMAERNRVAALHAEASDRAAQLMHQLARVSAENVHLRHQLAGTTPVSVAIALDRAARAVTGMGAAELAVELAGPDERFDQSEPDDTLVMAVEDLSAEELRMFGAEVCCG